MQAARHTFIHVAEVYQRSGNSLATVLCVDRVVEVVPVLHILLTLLVVQHLQHMLVKHNTLCDFSHAEGRHQAALPCTLQGSSAGVINHCEYECWSTAAATGCLHSGYKTTWCEKP